MATSTECLQAQFRETQTKSNAGSISIRNAWRIVEQWYERRKQRKALLALDDRLLKDIGISRADAEREGGKPFWRG